MAGRTVVVGAIVAVGLALTWVLYQSSGGGTGLTLVVPLLATAGLAWRVWRGSAPDARRQAPTGTEDDERAPYG